MSGSACTTDAKQWIIQRCTQRLRPAQCVGGFELIYEDFDIEPVTEERMQAKLKMLATPTTSSGVTTWRIAAARGTSVLNGNASWLDANPAGGEEAAEKAQE